MTDLFDRLSVAFQRRKVLLASGWKPVIVAEAVDADGDCPFCAVDALECPCPVADLDGWEYQTQDGILYARPRCDA